MLPISRYQTKRDRETAESHSSKICQNLVVSNDLIYISVFSKSGVACKHLEAPSGIVFVVWQVFCDLLLKLRTEPRYLKHSILPN